MPYLCNIIEDALENRTSKSDYDYLPQLADKPKHILGHVGPIGANSTSPEVLIVKKFTGIDVPKTNLS